MEGTSAPRKPHVVVPQERYLEVMRELDCGAVLEDIAGFLRVSEATARRKLDGLVAQGKLGVHHGRFREYYLK